MAERLFEVQYRKGNMVEALTVAVDEATHRGIGCQRSEELQKGAPDRDHRLLHTLSFHRLPVQRRHSVAGVIEGDGLLEIGDGNGDVVQVVELHHTFLWRQKVALSATF